MKIKKDFVLKEIAGNWILVPFGSSAVDFNGVVTLNETAKFLYENCNDDIDNSKLKRLLLEKYCIDDKTAENAINIFIQQLTEAGCVDE